MEKLIAPIRLLQNETIHYFQKQWLPRLDCSILRNPQHKSVLQLSCPKEMKFLPNKMGIEKSARTWVKTPRSTIDR